MTRHWLLASALGGLVALLASCASGSDSQAAAEEKARLFFGETTITVNDVDDEFDRIRETFIRSEEDFAACVTRLGYDYAPRVLRVEYVDVDATGQLPTIADVRGTYGYGVVRSPEHTMGISVTTEGGLTTGDSRAFFDAVLTNNEGGCGDLYYRESVQEQLVQVRFDTAAPPDALQAHPDMVNAENEWVRCMAELGHHFGDRREPVAEIMNQLATVAPDDAERIDDLAHYEVQVAVSDTDCFLTHIAPVIERLAG